MPYDVTLGPDPDGTGTIAHRPDCEFVRHQADVLELPVMTMIGCETPLPSFIPRHECMEEE